MSFSPATIPIRDRAEKSGGGICACYNSSRRLLALVSVTLYSLANLPINSTALLSLTEMVPPPSPSSPRPSSVSTASSTIFHYATRVQNASATLLRSYETTDPGESDYVCEVWEAARATSAAPLFFAPFRIERLGLTLVDGALRLNNPINEVISEAHRIYPD